MTDRKKDTDSPNLDRRKMLMRLGLAATAIYSAPVLLQLNTARASGGSWGSRGSGSGSGRGRSRYSNSYSYGSGSGGRRRRRPVPRY